MRRLFLAMLVLGLTALAGNAHFVLVVPDANGTTAKVIFSDSLEPDANVPIAKISGIKLFLQDASGKVTPVAHTTEKHHLAAKLPAKATGVVYGSVTYGVLAKGDAKPFLLKYHPKTVIGDVPANQVTLGDKVPTELVPVREGKAVRLQLLAGGKPVPNAEVNLMNADETESQLTTNEQGLTPVIAHAGHYGAWARYAEKQTGEENGKKYSEVRHYATLVFNVTK